MKEKQEVIDAIEAIPEFEMIDIFIDRDGEKILNEKFKAVTEKGSSDILSVVTNKYQLAQFKESFLPTVEKIEGLDGRVIYHRGNALAEIYPKGENFVVEGGQRIGLMIRNSVTTESALLVNFTIASKNWHVIVPRNVKGFRKVHIGNQKIAENFMRMVDEVKPAWKQIATEFTTYRPTEDELKELVCGRMKFSEKRLDGIKEKMYSDGNRPNLWEIYLEMVRKISEEGNFSSGINEEKQIEKICSAMIGYAMSFAL